MKNTIFNFVIIIIVVSSIFSCNAYRKIPYFQDIEYSKGHPENIENYKSITIQPSDIVSVSVSSLNPLAYNDSTGRNAGYLVRPDGNIKLPLVGSINVGGLTTSQAEENIQKELSPYLKNVDVSVRLKNFKVSILGDVARPDVYKASSERFTITEALSMAGDLNITARRDNILLIREVDGRREYIMVNLTKENVFKAPYYYLKNNDIIYVQPDKTKYASVDGSYRTFSLVLSGLSIIAIILTNVL